MRARRTLEAERYLVVAEAADGAAGLQAVRRDRPDVVLLVGILLLSHYVEDRYLGELLPAAPRASSAQPRHAAHARLPPVPPAG
jgi:DNA-binding NarL/FixJ family response regulator